MVLTKHARLLLSSSCSLHHTSFGAWQTVQLCPPTQCPHHHSNRSQRVKCCLRELSNGRTTHNQHTPSLLYQSFAACCHCRAVCPCPANPVPQASQLQSLVLRCSHASVYAATESMESLSKLTALTSLRMGPNPEDIFPHSSPLGFPRLPSFLASLSLLQHIDISMADSATTASLSVLDFTPIRHVPDVKITLRADTSIRAVAHLPASISSVAGLTGLTVQVREFGTGLAAALAQQQQQCNRCLVWLTL